MNKQIVHFSVDTSCNNRIKVGRSVIEHPPIVFGGGSIKWFDDSQLLKKNNNKDQKQKKA